MNYSRIKLILLILSFTVSSVFAFSNNTLTEPKEDKCWVEKVGDWYEENTNYGTITILMAVESSFIPFPSEIVIPPAAYVASQPNSKLSIPLIIFFATLGALIGALINYFLALFLGRPILYKFADSKIGHLLLLSSEKIGKAEVYFNKKGKVSTFIGRLIPGIRQLISVPAGLAKMNLISFSLFTALGAGIWNIVLALLGYFAHGQKEVIERYSREIGIGIVIFLVFVGFVYLLKSFLIKQKDK